LQVAYEQLQALDERKDEFLYTVTHELRTPLTSIRALSEILSDNPDLDEEERLRFLHTITKESERLSRLITLVLDLEKYESGKATLTAAPVAIGELVAEAVESVEQLAHARHIQLTMAVAPDLPSLPADRDRLMQVLVNLLSNAVKACSADGSGRIWVGAEAIGGQLHLRVTDNGKGIDPAYHHLIFDKFYQAQHQTIRKPEGSGLGLAITRNIVELHQGRIWVESAPEQGASFSLTLPLHPQRQPQPTDPQRQPQPTE